MKTILWQGDFHNLNSFKISNENLSLALEKAGKQVFRAPTDYGASLDLHERPDVYLFHNYPYNVVDLPGKINLFFLQYEYFHFQEKDLFLVDGLNCCFDALIVASEFTKRACVSSGVKIPVYVCNLGFDPLLFNPTIKPLTVNSAKSFKFINLGGAFARKGLDVLVQAYTEEFSAKDDVSLIIKAFSYQKHLDWFRDVLARSRDKENAPEIIFFHSEDDEIGGYYTACDMGVFPYRGEGFGLTTLEALACGLPVIVTEGGSTDDFCNAENSTKIRAERKVSEDRDYLEPSLDHLRTLMRSSIKNKKTMANAQRINQTVSGRTWDASANHLLEIIGEVERSAGKRRTEVKVSGQHPKSVILISEEHIPDSDEFLWSSLAQGLKGSGVDFQITSFPMPLPREINTSTIIARSGSAFEYFSEVNEQAKHIRKVLLFDHFPEDHSFALDNAERIKLSVKPDIAPGYKAMDVWRKDQELTLADELIVFDSVTQEYLQARYPSKRVHKISPPLSATLELPADEMPRPLRFLFWGSAPFQRGISALFEAWNSLKPQNSELICIMNNLVFLTSHQLLKRVVQNPNIIIHNILDGENLASLIENCDIQVLPTSGDGYFRQIGKQMAAGKPAIVSDRSGMKDFIEPGVTGVVYYYSDPDGLQNAIQSYLERREQIFEIKESCYKHMRNYSYERFTSEIIAHLNILK